MNKKIYIMQGVFKKNVFLTSSFLQGAIRSRGALMFIGLLLLIAGIEANPGPGKEFGRRQRNS